ncbi:MAG: hypothetical protein GY816_15385 [Cytophagales bacterium]|nr:hypothetical protein [Cytophagales bacterium]
MVSPLANPSNKFDGINQVFYGDAVFIKDFSKLNDFSKVQLLKLATILHDIYNSFDVVLRVLIFIDGVYKTTYSNKYVEFITNKTAN